MSYLLKQSSTDRPLLFLMIDSTDHISPKAGLSPTATISKNGGAFAAPAGAVSEIGNGWYQAAPNATDTNTLGPLLLHATASGADPTDTAFEVVAFDPQSAGNLGLSSLPAGSPGAAGGLPTVNASNYIAGLAGSTYNTLDALAAHGDTAWATGSPPTASAIASAVTAAVLATPANKLATDSTGRVTVGGNADKTGYTISGTKATLDALNDISASGAASAVWNEPLASHTTAGSAGAQLTSIVISGADPLAAALPGSYAAGTAGAAWRKYRT